MSHTDSPAGAAENAALAIQLRTVLHRLSRQLRRESMPLGASPLQTLLLALIHDQPGVGVGELARQEKLRGPTISGHVKALEAAGLVVRSQPDPNDRRRVGLHASARGSAMIEELRQRRTDWLAAALGELAEADREAIRQAIGPLGELVERQ